MLLLQWRSSGSVFFFSGEIVGDDGDATAAVLVLGEDGKWKMVQMQRFFFSNLVRGGDLAREIAGTMVAREAVVAVTGHGGVLF